MNITPTKSVIEGWNGTIKGIEALAACLERKQLNKLYNEFSLFHESLDDFENRMSDTMGANWVNKLTR